MSKNILIATTCLLAFMFAVSFLFSDDDSEVVESGDLEAKAKTRIAACNTCYGSTYERVSALDDYEMIRTGSTGESIRLFLQGEADMIISGRTLKPEEPRLDQFVIEEGYSFLSDSGMLVYRDELEGQSIFTDLDAWELKSDLSLREVVEVDDVYDYLDQGVVVTSWENTDYSRAEIVHVYERDGQRFGPSRQPTLYCPGSCQREETKKLISVLKNNK